MNHNALPWAHNERSSGVLPQDSSREDTQTINNVPSNFNSALLGIESMLRRQLQLSREAYTAAALGDAAPDTGEGLVGAAAPGSVPEVASLATGDIESGDLATTQRRSSPFSSATTTTEDPEEERADGNAGDDTIALLSGDTVTRVELQSALRWLEQGLPFLLLLLLIFLYQHRTGIITFVWLTVVLHHMNTIVKKQVSRKQSRQIGPLVGVIGIILMHVNCTYFLFREDEFWRSLVFLPPIAPSFWEATWIIVLNDLMVRYVSMIIKAAAVISIGHLPPFKRRTQLYAVIEIAANMYRNVLPVAVWFAYLVGDRDERIFSSLTAGIYLVFKLGGILAKARRTAAVLRAYMLNEVRYGKIATQDQIQQAGDLCAICQEKMKDPIVLHCDHMFCDDCVSRWFEREKTCPLCRSVINTAGHKTHSDGSTSLLVQLF